MIFLLDVRKFLNADDPDLPLRAQELSLSQSQTLLGKLDSIAWQEVGRSQLVIGQQTGLQLQKVSIYAGKAMPSLVWA